MSQAIDSAICVLRLGPTTGYVVLHNKNPTDVVSTVAILLRGLSGLSGVPSVVVWTKAIHW